MRYSGKLKPAVYQDEGRYSAELTASVHIYGGETLPASLVNFSRHGFRVNLPRNLAAGQVLWLEVHDWPRLMGSVIWSQDQRAGCMFSSPPDEEMFAVMCASSTGMDRVI